jgi:hypothetical protein
MDSSQITKHLRELGLARALFSDLPQRAQEELPAPEQAHPFTQRAVRQLAEGFAINNKKRQDILEENRPAANSVAQQIASEIREDWIVGTVVLGSAEVRYDANTIETVSRNVAKTLRQGYIELGLTTEPIADGFSTTAERELLTSPR